MELTISGEILRAATDWAALSLPASTMPPVLAGLVLRATGAGLTVSAYDYEVATLATATAEVVEPGAVLVPGRLLVQIARQLPAAPVTLRTDGSALLLAAAAGTYRLATLPLADYPPLPARPATIGTVDSGQWRRAIQQVTTAAGRDPTLPVLTGVCVRISGEEISLACTDRYRIAARSLAWTPVRADLDVTLLLPAGSLAAIARALPDGRPAQLGHDGALASLSCAGMVALLRPLDGTAIDLPARLPAAGERHAHLATAPLIAAIKRIALIAGRLPTVDLTFRPGEVRLAAASGEQVSATATLVAEYDGAELTMGFNARYLVDGLAALGAPTARFDFTDPARAALISGTGSGLRYLLGGLRRN